MGQIEPYSRQEYAGALVANAVAKPFNVLLAVATIGAATALSVDFVLALVVGLVIYAIAATWTFFDADEAAAVLERERGERSGVVLAAVGLVEVAHGSVAH